VLSGEQRERDIEEGLEGRMTKGTRKLLEIVDTFMNSMVENILMYLHMSQ
jgi:hypothetical protein